MLSASYNFVEALLADLARFSSERAARAAAVAQEITKHRSTNAILLSQSAPLEHADTANKRHAYRQSVKKGIAAVEAICFILVELLHSLLSCAVSCRQGWIVVIHCEVHQHKWQDIQQSPFSARRPKGSTLVKPKLQAWTTA